MACHGCGSLFICETFRNLTPEKRFEMAKHNRLCYNCLKGGHSSAECKADSTCSAKGCKGRSGGSVITYALLDNGSTNTFCSTDLLAQLGSCGKKTSLSLTTLDREGSKMKTSIHELEVSDAQGQHKVTLSQVIAR